ncbi:MAG: putative baseplate assembly protein [Symploca sp. SIO1B1]|nr:putative baseplate assembly protein [Symploca sp. SIO1B1]
MSIQPPKIDKRTYEDLVEQTRKLAEDFTKYTDIKNGWKPSDKPDAGMALIRIFARMAISISDRLNKVPEKNFLAFLNLIGAQRLPPQPARVPLTFTLTPGSPSYAVVPAGTQVSAPPDEGEDEEVIFETEQELVVSAAQLQAVFVRGWGDTEKMNVLPQKTSLNGTKVNYYSDRTLEATTQEGEAFKAFVGDNPIEHYLYLACEEVFSLPQLNTVTLTIVTGSPDDATELRKLLEEWCYWDGTYWQTLSSVNSNVESANLRIKLTRLPTFKSCRINGQEAKWLRIGLEEVDGNLTEITNITATATINQENITPQLCLFNDTPLDLSKDFYPFGEEPRKNDTFYLALDDELIKPEVEVTLNFQLSQVGIKTDELEIRWEYGDGKEWVKITDGNKVGWNAGSNSPDFTQDSFNLTIKFTTDLPEPSTVNEETHYWIRAVITKGHFGTPEKPDDFIYFEDSTFLTHKVDTSTKQIKVDSVDGLKKGDIIRFQPDNQPPKSKRTITDINIETKTIELKENIDSGYEAGTRIQKKKVVTETIPATYEPPIVASLKLSYNFTIDKPVSYIAYNDFNYFEGKSWSARIAQAAREGDTIIQLEHVDYLAVGEFLLFAGEKYQIDEIEPIENKDSKQIVSVNRSKKQVTLKSGLHQDVPKETTVTRPFYPVTPPVESKPTLYFGFQQQEGQLPFQNNNTTLYLDVQPPLPEEVVPESESTDTSNLSQKADSSPPPPPVSASPRLIWEYSSPNGWKELGVKDETAAFSRRGLIQFLAPGDICQRQEFEKQLYWLRVRWESGEFKFGVKPRLKRVLTNTVWATQTETLHEEILGSSAGEAGQKYQVRQPPVLNNQRLEVEEGSIPPPTEREAIAQKLGKEAIKLIVDEDGQQEAVWVTWLEVEDFYTSEPGDRHYMLDRLSGRIEFGDGIAGKVPPRGRNNLRLTYTTGGGTSGNQKAGTITQLKTTIPYIDGVSSIYEAQGGAAVEELDRVKERVPKKLRHRGRAVTLQDFEDLAYAASTEVARVKVITPGDAHNWNPVDPGNWIDKGAVEEGDEESDREEIEAGKITVIIVPNSSDRIPTPSLELINRVETYLSVRTLPTVTLAVTGPKWQEITVTTTIVPRSLAGAAELRTEVQNRLSSFLHPLTGGKSGNGWNFGRYPHKSDLYAFLQGIAGVDYVEELEVNVEELEVNVAVKIDEYTLIYSGEHKVRMKNLEFRI